MGLGLYSVFRAPLPGAGIPAGCGRRSNSPPTAKTHRELSPKRRAAGQHARQPAQKAATKPPATRCRSDAGGGDAGVPCLPALTPPPACTSPSGWSSFRGRRFFLPSAAGAHALCPTTRRCRSSRCSTRRCRETERLHPSLIFCMRGAARDFTFWRLRHRKGSKVAYSPLLHRPPAGALRAPERVRPERFLDGWKPPPYSLCGFGGGYPRLHRQAVRAAGMRLLTNLILQRFDLAALPDQSAGFTTTDPQRCHGFMVQLSWSDFAWGLASQARVIGPAQGDAKSRNSAGRARWATGRIAAAGRAALKESGLWPQVGSPSVRTTLRAEAPPGTSRACPQPVQAAA